MSRHCCRRQDNLCTVLEVYAMPDYICHGCNQRKPQSQVSECSKCGKILCNTCKGNAYHCKDSPKGKAGCDGKLERC